MKQIKVLYHFILIEPLLTPSFNCLFTCIFNKFTRFNNYFFLPFFLSFFCVLFSLDLSSLHLSFCWQMHCSLILSSLGQQSRWKVKWSNKWPRRALINGTPTTKRSCISFSCLSSKYWIRQSIDQLRCQQIELITSCIKTISPTGPILWTKLLWPPQDDDHNTKQKRNHSSINSTKASIVLIAISHGLVSVGDCALHPKDYQSFLMNCSHHLVT